MSTEQFSPTRYPYTYAADYLRQNPQIVPREVWEAANADEFRREGRYLDSLLSRSQAAGMRRRWSETMGLDNDEMAIEHADRFLVTHGILKPGQESLEDVARDVAAAWRRLNEGPWNQGDPFPRDLDSALDRLAAVVDRTAVATPA